MKPNLVFLPGNASVEDVLTFYRMLTGREATPEDRAATEALYANANRDARSGPKRKPPTS